MTGRSLHTGVYGPLIKSPAEDLPENTQQNESAAKGEDSWWPKSSWIMVCHGVLAPSWHQTDLSCPG